MSSPAEAALALRERLRGPQAAAFAGVRFCASADIAWLAKAAGLDALYVDLEHASMGPAEVAGLCLGAAGAGLAALVRVPWSDAPALGRVLDAGAAGVLASGVETAAQALSVVRTARFPPAGHRSWASPSAQLGHVPTPVAKALGRLDEATLVGVMAESPEAVERIEAIAGTPGLDLVMLGAMDLSITLGVAGALSDPRIAEAIVRVGAACRRHGKVFALGGIRDDAGLLKLAQAEGARLFSVGSDALWLAAAARQHVEALRRALA